MSIQQHFQNWGNSYQSIFSFLEVLVGVFFGWLSWRLWRKDRDKEIKIKELADQTKILKTLLDEFIAPKLSGSMSYVPQFGNYLLTIVNEGNTLYDFEISSKINIAIHIQTACKYVDENKAISISMSYLNSEPKGETTCQFKDKFNRTFSQQFIFEADEIIIKPYILIN
jgi:hypothetical protein